jgi:methionine-rich copper-binding protein CopC
MRIIKPTAVAIALLSGLLVSTLAQAHPKLLSSTPAEGVEGASPEKIELHFPKTSSPSFPAQNC